MFTLEDVNLADELEFFRVHGLDVMHTEDLHPGEARTDPEADARLHPGDYFIAGV